MAGSLTSLASKLAGGRRRRSLRKVSRKGKKSMKRVSRKGKKSARRTRRKRGGQWHGAIKRG